MEASNPQIIMPSDPESGPVVMVFEKHQMCTSEWTQIGIMHFTDINLMKLNVQEEYFELPKTEGSTSDSKPSFYDMNWAGSIRTSKFTLVY